MNRRATARKEELRVPVLPTMSTSNVSSSLMTTTTTTTTNSTMMPLTKQKRRRKVRQQKNASFLTSSGTNSCSPMIMIPIALFGVVLVGGAFVFGILLASDWASSSKRSSTDTVVGVAATAAAAMGDNDKKLNGFPAYPKISRGGGGGVQHPEQLSQQALDMCTQTLWHTIESTTIVLPHGETFIHTGDIDDLWLRDSAAQVHTLLIPVFKNNNGHGEMQALVAQDPKLDRIVAGLIQRTALYIRHDPYANAFRIDDSYVFSAMQKKMGRHDLISTWNYELDSACYYIRMLYYYWKAHSSSSSSNNNNNNKYHSVLRLPQVQEAVQIMVDVWTAEQQHENNAVPTGPLFDDCINCHNGKLPYRYPGLARNGKGSMTNASSGLTWTGFRPSDDACVHHFLIPANMFAVVVLGYVVEFAQSDLWNNNGQKLANQAQKLAQAIERGIQEHAIVDHPKYGSIYAYEVDGFGHYNLMDDANVPNLLSIPYLGYNYDEEIYANTRRFVFSPDNPTYKKQNSNSNSNSHPDSDSTVGHNTIEGYGSPHMQARIQNNIWPMSLAMKGLTSDSVEEKVQLVETLVKASAGTLWMHESIDVNRPASFTRSWFCWADSLFAELVLSLTESCPNLSHKYRVLEWRDPEFVPGGVYAED